MLGFVAALIAGQTNLLPPSRAAGVVRDLFASYPESCCLADHNELPAGLPAMIVPPWPRPRVRSEMPPVPADQTAMIVFTSGSTGRPQPHAKSWRSLVRAARGLARRLGSAPGRARRCSARCRRSTCTVSRRRSCCRCRTASRCTPARPLLPADIAAALAEMPPRALARDHAAPAARVHRRERDFPGLAGVLSRHDALAARPGAGGRRRGGTRRSTKSTAAPRRERWRCAGRRKSALARLRGHARRGRKAGRHLVCGRAPRWRAEAARLRRDC